MYIALCALERLGFGVCLGSSGQDGGYGAREVVLFAEAYIHPLFYSRIRIHDLYHAQIGAVIER